MNLDRTRVTGIGGLLAVTIAGFWLILSGERSQGVEISVYAAASLGEVMNKVGKSFEADQKASVRMNFAGSNVLAQQILAADQADVFISANQDWMDHVENEKRTKAGTRRAILSNRLVVIAHVSTVWVIRKPEDLAELAIRFVSLGDPDAVPVGLYAKNYLAGIEYQSGTLWGFLESKVAPAPDARAALGLVESDPGIIGIVYHTDAKASDNVRILYEIPEDEVAPIEYFAAMIDRHDASPLARSFYDFLFSQEASRIFEAHGFVPVRTEVIDP